MPDAAQTEPAVLPTPFLSFFAALVVVGFAAYVLGGRSTPRPPTNGSVLVWSGHDGARYYVDTGSARLVGTGTARHGALTAYYVAPLSLRWHLRIRSPMREDRLTLDCAHGTLDGSATWQDRRLGASPGVSPESIFAGPGARGGPRATALQYVCERPATPTHAIGATR